MKVDVIIPVYGPGNRLLELFDRLGRQTVPVDRLIIMNTEKYLWDKWTETLEPGRLPENLSVYHVTKEEFDHGATRDAGIGHSDADVCVCMTHDALPADTNLIKALTDALFSGDDIAVAYARQLPATDCNIIERHTRDFNYPDKSRVKRLSDLDTLGIKTYFCSNVCAAYKREIYRKLGGFIRKTIFNEDMIFAAKAMKNGYAVYYAADARVIHSHNYTASQQFHRNFDLGVSQAEHPEIFAAYPSESEGKRMVKDVTVYLRSNHMSAGLPHFYMQCACKYAGYLLGKNYRRLPGKWVLAFTSNKEYWKQNRKDV